MTQNTTGGTFSSSWGTIVSTAGVAIGLGNIWRFPYMMGQHGGAWFLLAYLLIAIAFGLPALMAEWALARHTRCGTLGAFEKAGLPWGRYAGYLLILTVLMAGSYYVVIVAWVLYFACHFGGNAIGLSGPGDFDVLVESWTLQGVFLIIVAVLGGGALCLGVRRGIEKVSRWGLPIFFALVLILMVRVLMIDGAWAGLREFLVPRWENFSRTTPLAALGQVFFSFGLGGTFMLVYGSYMRDDEDIPRVAICTAGADIAAALMAGMIVIPAALAFHLPTSSGATLMFEVMPAVFQQMSGGAWFGAMFFGSVFVVALLSQMAAYEVVVGALAGRMGWSRKWCVVITVTTSCVLAIPALRSIRYIESSDMIWGSTMQPVGALFAVVALVWCGIRGQALSEIRRESRLPVPNWLFYWIKFGIPIGIVSTLVFYWLG